ncbi:MAG: hypothetical protein ACI4P8_04060 [Akkermansia sp.]
MNFGSASNYDTLVSSLTDKDTWYLSANANGRVTNNSSGVTDSDAGVVLVAGGPNESSAVGAIKFSISAADLANYEGPITFSFDAATWSGNNNKYHQITFYLLSEVGTLKSDIYRNERKEDATDTTTSAVGTLLGISTDPTHISLTFNADQVERLQASGVDQTFVFMACSNELVGSCTSVLMSNFTLTPESTTATLSLLALVGLAARRRRA